MPINLSDNLQITSTKPLSTREQYATLSDMQGANKRGLNSGLIAYCLEDKQHYKFVREDESVKNSGEWVKLVSQAEPSNEGVGNWR